MINPKTLQWSRPREWCIPLDKTSITNGRYSSALLFTRPQWISPCDHNPFTPSTMKQLDHEWTQMDADTRLMGMERKLEITLVKLYLYCMWLFYIIFATVSLMLMTLGGGLEPMFMCFHSSSLVEDMMDIVKTTPVVLKILAMIFIHGFSYCKESANRAAECTQWRIPLWMWSLVAKASIRVQCFWHTGAIFFRFPYSDCRLYHSRFASDILQNQSEIILFRRATAPTQRDQNDQCCSIFVIRNLHFWDSKQSSRKYEDI